MSTPRHWLKALRSAGPGYGRGDPSAAPGPVAGVITFLLFAVLLPGSARADDLYYMMIFGAQRTPTQPQYTHSFATFVRARVQPGEVLCVVESQTISWMPRSMEIRLYRLAPECGTNLDLHTSIHYVLSEGERLSMWGPYQIEKELYDRAAAQVCLLQSGTVRYKAVDTGYPTDRASNCIHAISSIAAGYRLRVLSPSWGEMASYYINRRLQPWVIHAEIKHDWVASALGLDCYPIIRRDCNPRSGQFLGFALSIFGTGGDGGD